jgi:hypothetical protein
VHETVCPMSGSPLVTLKENLSRTRCQQARANSFRQFGDPTYNARRNAVREFHPSYRCSLAELSGLAESENEADDTLKGAWRR